MCEWFDVQGDATASDLRVSIRHEEIHRLRNLLKRVPAITNNSAFGGSNAEAIRAQIAVLEERLSYETAEERYEEDVHVFGYALNACDWMRNGGESPSGEWERLVAGQPLENISAAPNELAIA